MSRLKLDTNAQQLAQQAFTLGKEADFPLRQVIQEFREACGQRADLLRFLWKFRCRPLYTTGN
ncbi:Dna-J like membrane chaperone protein [Actinobacillus equuli]|nr:Dna-J like membrane chaperone protein [Actinobacillus equuli]